MYYVHLPKAHRWYSLHWVSIHCSRVWRHKADCLNGGSLSGITSQGKIFRPGIACPGATRSTKASDVTTRDDVNSFVMFARYQYVGTGAYHGAERQGVIPDPEWELPNSHAFNTFTLL